MHHLSEQQKAYICSTAHKAFNIQIYLPKCLPSISVQITAVFNDIYIYIYIYIYIPLVALRPNAGQGLLILEVSRLHTTTHHSQ